MSASFEKCFYQFVQPGVAVSNRYLHLAQVRGKMCDQIVLSTGESVFPAGIETMVRQMLPFISHAMVIGHGRSFIAIFVTLKTMVSTTPVADRTPLDPTTMEQLRTRNISVSTLEEATRSRELNEMIIAAIQKINQQLTREDQSSPHIKRCVTLPCCISVASV